MKRGRRSRSTLCTTGQTCDVCVVGAGYSGLSTALHLAESRKKVIVLEAVSGDVQPLPIHTASDLSTVTKLARSIGGLEGPAVAVQVNWHGSPSSAGQDVTAWVACDAERDLGGESDI